MPWLFTMVFPCHWWDSLVLGSLEGFCSPIICTQIVPGREDFVATNSWYKWFSQAVVQLHITPLEMSAVLFMWKSSWKPFTTFVQAVQQRWARFDQLKHLVYQWGCAHTKKMGGLDWSWYPKVQVIHPKLIQMIKSLKLTWKSWGNKISHFCQWFFSDRSRQLNPQIFTSADIRGALAQENGLQGH